MPADVQQSAGASLLKQSLVIEVRPGPDPQVARLALLLVDEVDGRQHRERVRPGLPGTVSIQVWPAGAVGARRVVQRDLDVTEPEVHRVGRHQLPGDVQRAGAPQRDVGGGKPLGRQEPEVLADRSSRRWIGRDESIDLIVDAGQQGLGNHTRHDQVSVLPEPPQLLGGQHHRTLHRRRAADWGNDAVGRPAAEVL